MSVILVIENNASSPITTVNYGSIPGASSQAYRFNVTNNGTAAATSVQIVAERITSNDGVDYVMLAPDVAGNPGTYSANLLNIGTLAAGAVYWFWVEVVVPTSASPAGNPRVFNIAANYVGT